MVRAWLSRLVAGFFGGRLQTVLITSFVFVAILTAVLNTVVIARVINDHLEASQEERVLRDMDIAQGLYRQKLRDVEGIGERTANDPQTIMNLYAAFDGDVAARGAIDQVISRKITVPRLGGSQMIMILDQNGDLLIGRVLSPNGELSSALLQGNWEDLPIVMEALNSLQPVSGTEIIPASILEQVSLKRQAFVPLRETSQAATQLFDPREGTAGLALVSVYPLKDAKNNILGVVLTACLFNNDISFVDFAADVAKIETTTIFFGDLRVSTNVLDADGRRAVGTRVSQTVYDQVLVKGQNYIGRAFVVSDWYIGRYLPLRDHRSNVVGMLYVGARESAFRNLVYAFNSRVIMIAVICILVAGIIAIPIARLITRPIIRLVDAHRKLATGDMQVHVQPYGRGEIAQLGQSFNSMVDTLSDTQRELLHKDKLASMGQLAAGVAHELNNPLGTILLFADAMYRDVGDGDPRREDLKMIISEAYRCKTIVADLLNFARQHELMAQETNLNALLVHVVEKLSNRPKFEPLAVIQNFDPQLPIVQADPAQLQQAFINLLNNSADAMAGSGTITISTKIVNGQCVEICISDTGSGIPPEYMDKMFTPFFTTKPAGKGTGLGLSIVYGIVKMHRGQIRVQSKPGEGATFTITLPIRLPNGQADQPIHEPDLII